MQRQRSIPEELTPDEEDDDELLPALFDSRSETFDSEILSGDEAIAEAFGVDRDSGFGL